MKEKVFSFATSTGSMIRSLPIVLGLILCAVIGFGGIALLSWALDFITEIAESNIMKVACIGFVLYASVKSKKGNKEEGKQNCSLHWHYRSRGNRLCWVLSVPARRSFGWLVCRSSP